MAVNIFILVKKLYIYISVIYENNNTIVLEHESFYLIFESKELGDRILFCVDLLDVIKRYC